MLRTLVFAIAVALLAGPAFAQSQAANGTIAGTVADSSGGVLPGVTVAITNADTGLERSVVTNADGGYRGLLLPLGRHKIVAELQGFKKAEQAGIGLQAGDTATINFALSVGTVSETVTVTAEAPIAQPGKSDLGRTISDTEIHNRPLPSRNPYNFAFLQANVTGYENSEFGVPRINANGSRMHTNFQLDGNTNTEKDRAGLRLLPISEVLVREVKVVTNGFAPEFGQTTGMVYNAITQSGTNNYSGSASYRFKRNSMSTALFFLSAPIKPDTKADDITAAIGGPLKKDKAFFFGAYEWVNRKVPFAFGKVDYQVAPSTLVTGRYFFFQNISLSNVNGGLNTTERATDFHDKMWSAAEQAITTIGSSNLNEFRYQFAQRHQFRTMGTGADGPGIIVSGIAQFGGPRQGNTDNNSVGFDFTQKINQVIDNFTWIKGSHALKAGVDVQFVGDDRVQGENFQYTFPTIDAYLAAVVGSGDDRVSDPTNLGRDTGVTPFNQTHTLTVSTAYSPRLSGDGVAAYLANNNQLGVITQANSGLPFNIRSNRDLNGGGVTNDRPLGLERNVGRLGTVFNVDFRYSRFVPISGTTEGEVFLEGKNLFNHQNIAGVNRVVTTDVAGVPAVDVSNTTATGTAGQPFTGTSGYDQRVAQVGFKVSF